MSCSPPLVSIAPEESCPEESGSEDPNPGRRVRNTTHEDSLTDFLATEYELINQSLLADVSVYCGEAEFKAHRIVLSHYSDFFRAIFESLPGAKHFDVFLEGFHESHVHAVLTFMYTGSVVIPPSLQTTESSGGHHTGGDGGGGGGNPPHVGILSDVANALQIPLLSNFLSEKQVREERDEGNDRGSSNNNVDHCGSSSSPVSMWEKCERSSLILQDDEEEEPPIEFVPSGDEDVEEDEEEEEEDDDDDEIGSYYEFQRDRKNKGNHNVVPSDSVSKRRKQARPQRHKPTPPHSRSVSPEECNMSCTDEECSFDEELDPQSPLHPPSNPERTPPRPINNPLPTPPLRFPVPDHPPGNASSPQQQQPQQQQQGQVPPLPQPVPHGPAPPPHFLFLRNMINNPHLGGGAHPHGPVPPGPPQQQQPGVPPPPPHFFPHHPVLGKKLGGIGQQKHGMWGKLIGKGPGGGMYHHHHHHHHGSSRAQHSAPRGGPPRAWSNQDLTEALHNVWNKKMTTSQASRIFGIPYNSLLMYVRGKYGKSLKLDLLKKGLDLALLEKQQKMKTAAGSAPNPAITPTTPNTGGQQQQNGGGGSGGGGGGGSSVVSAASPSRNNNVVEWIMGGGNKILEQQQQHQNHPHRGLFHAAAAAGLFFGGNAPGGATLPEQFLRGKQEMGK